MSDTNRESFSRTPSELDLIVKETREYKAFLRDAIRERNRVRDAALDELEALYRERLVPAPQVSPRGKLSEWIADYGPRAVAEAIRRCAPKWSGGRIRGGETALLRYLFGVLEGMVADDIMGIGAGVGREEVFRQRYRDGQ